MNDGRREFLFFIFIFDAMEWLLVRKMWSPRITVDIFCPSCLIIIIHQVKCYCSVAQQSEWGNNLFLLH